MEVQTDTILLLVGVVLLVVLLSWRANAYIKFKRQPSRLHRLCSDLSFQFKAPKTKSDFFRQFD